MANSELRNELMYKLFDEHCTHMRHHEGQRSTVASSMIAISGVLIGIATYDDTLDIADMPMLSMIVAIGIFGGLFSGKQYERAAMHMERARAYRKALDDQFSDSPAKSIKEEADKIHKQKFPFLSRFRIHKMWFILYGFVALIGLYYITMVLYDVYF